MIEVQNLSKSYVRYKRTLEIEPNPLAPDNIAVNAELLKTVELAQDLKPLNLIQRPVLHEH